MRKTPTVAREESIKYAYKDYARGEGLGDVFSDRSFPEWPLMKGKEISEEEFEALACGLPAEDVECGCGERDFAEWPRHFGYEVRAC